MLQLEQRHWKIVQQILSKYPYDFYAYGSRVKGEAWKLSDLDLCYYDDIPSSVICEMREEFEQSNLPFVVDGNRCGLLFKKPSKRLIVLISPLSFQGAEFSSLKKIKLMKQNNNWSCWITSKT